jgi:hypothetical protein
LALANAALNRFLARRVQTLAQVSEAIGVDLFLEALPDVAGNQFLVVLALRALRTQRTVAHCLGSEVYSR